LQVHLQQANERHARLEQAIQASRRRLYPGQDSLQRVVIFGEHGIDTCSRHVPIKHFHFESAVCLLVAGNFFKQKQLTPMSTSTATILPTPLTRSTWWSISGALATPMASCRSGTSFTYRSNLSLHRQCHIIYDWQSRNSGRAGSARAQSGSRLGPS
jgi:hypothetical protein